jgi:hypothetical protein
MLTTGEQQGQTRDRAHRFRLELMAQFQTQIPYPLADQLPCLLTGGSMTVPAVGILLLVFIGERGFKGTAMQIQLDDVGSAGTDCVHAWIWSGEDAILVMSPPSRKALVCFFP